MAWKKSSFLILLFFGYGPTLRAQSIPPILERAAAEKKPLFLYPLTQQSILPLPDLPDNFSNTGLGFVKTKDQLYLLPQGTGRLYQLTGTPGNRTWIRIDSTYFTGYNFGFYPFSLDEKIYSFGGHGLWYTNGNLRYFNETAKEWHARLLSESIAWSYRPWAHAFLHVDSAQKKMTISAEGVTENNMLKHTRDIVHGKNIYQLDIATGDWKKLGNRKDTAQMTMATLPWGLLVDQTTVLDLQHNRYLHFTEELKNKMIGLTSRAYKNNAIFLFFAIDSTVYFGNIEEPYDSLTISRAELIDTGIPIYSPEEHSKGWDLEDAKSILILILSLIAITLSFLYWKKIKPQPMVAAINLPNPEPPAVAKPDTESDRSVSFRSTRILDLLEEREKSLLEFLYKHSTDERLTTIDEINRVIGVANRSNEIQKRMRSDLIGSINQKLGIITKDKKPVIDKQRSEFDKRSFEYFIQPAHMSLVEKVLGKK